MELLLIVACLLIGACTGIGIIFVFQQERVFSAVKNLQKFAASIKDYTELLQQQNREKSELQNQLNSIKDEILGLKQSTLQLVNERDVMEMAWYVEEGSLQSTNRVNVDEAIIYGRGQEWVYLDTFPAQEQLAHERRQKHFPMKLGMSAQDDVVIRVHQQVSGNSTAISERAVIRLVFRVNGSRDVERWMHEYLKRNGRQVSGSVGVEWFNTNPVEVEQLFRSYILQRTRQSSQVDDVEFV